MPDAYQQVRRKPEPPPMPDWKVRGHHAVQAGKRVVVQVMQGLPVRVPPDEVARRRGICEACDWWRAEAYAGSGGCGHAGCGCTALKLFFRTETCPVGKWTEA